MNPQAVSSSDLDGVLEWGRIRSYLRATTAPLALIEVDSEAQLEEVVVAVRGASRAVEVYRPEASSEEDPRRVLDWLEARQGSVPHDAVFLVLGLEKYTSDEDDARAFWGWMNLQRERWRTPFGKVVFVLTPQGVDYLARYATALWDWILLKFSLLNTPLPGETVERSDGDGTRTEEDIVADGEIVAETDLPSPWDERREDLIEPVTGTRFLWIPGGRFRMGGGTSDLERPAHLVRISPFWLAETPVTNRQYALFLEQTGREEPTLWRLRRFSATMQPVVGVSWHDAAAFCLWLSEKSSLAVNLPTEAQWEFAARGPQGREYPWGADEPTPSRACFGLDWHEGRPTEVGSLPAGRGPFGTLDQGGNVWEWCRDAWDAAAYAKRAGSLVVDPLVDEDGDPPRVLRGGGWWDPPDLLRAAARYWGSAALRNGDIGFRLAGSASP